MLENPGNLTVVSYLFIPPQPHPQGQGKFIVSYTEGKYLCSFRFVGKMIPGAKPEPQWVLSLPESKSSQYSCVQVYIIVKLRWYACNLLKPRLCSGPLGAQVNNVVHEPLVRFAMCGSTWHRALLQATKVLYIYCRSGIFSGTQRTRTTNTL